MLPRVLHMLQGRIDDACADAVSWGLRLLPPSFHNHITHVTSPRIQDVSQFRYSRQGTCCNEGRFQMAKAKPQATKKIPSQ